MYKVKHWLDDNEKITEFTSDLDFIFFVFKIRDENEDYDIVFNEIGDCIHYINYFCSNLEIIS